MVDDEEDEVDRGPPEGGSPSSPPLCLLSKSLIRCLEEEGGSADPVERELSLAAAEGPAILFVAKSAAKRMAVASSLMSSSWSLAAAPRAGAA